MKRLMLLLPLIAGIISSPFFDVQAQGISTYQMTNPYITTSGSFAGTFRSPGVYTSPYYSPLRTVSNTVNTDTFTQRILGWQYGVAVQFTYTKATGSPSGVVLTEVSCDTGLTGNYAVLYTDSVRNLATPQTYSHVVNGWPYSCIRLRYSGATVPPNSGNWKGVLIIR